MLLFNLVLFLCIGVRQTHADPHAVSLALEGIRQAAQQLSVAVVKWNGLVVTALPILLKSGATQRATKQATSLTIECDPFDLFQALEVGTVAKYLVQDVESLLHYMGAAQPKFKKAMLNRLVFEKIQAQERVCEDLFYEIISKLPNMARGEGEKLQKRVQLAFSVVKRKFVADEPPVTLDAGDDKAGLSDFEGSVEDEGVGDAFDFDMSDFEAYLSEAGDDEGTRAAPNIRDFETS